MRITKTKIYDVRKHQNCTLNSDLKTPATFLSSIFHQLIHKKRNKGIFYVGNASLHLYLYFLYIVPSLCLAEPHLSNFLTHKRSLTDSVFFMTNVALLGCGFFPNCIFRGFFNPYISNLTFIEMGGSVMAGRWGVQRLFCVQMGIKRQVHTANWRVARTNRLVLTENAKGKFTKGTTKIYYD